MRTTSGRGAALLAALLLVLGLAAGCGGSSEPPPAAPATTPCLEGAPPGECVGLTDGSYNLAQDPQFDAVFAAIFAENTRVAGMGKTVSVVYALPLPRQPNDLSRELREELQGAYLLQRRANDPQSDLAGQPLVQLQIANVGERTDGWQPVVTRMTQMLDPAQQGNVVGVAGLGQSLLTVRDAMGALGRAQVAMVPTRLTADGISPAPGQDGVFRIAPPNSEQVRAAAAFLTTSCRPVLVRDMRQDDLYINDLTANFPQLTAVAQARADSCAGTSSTPAPTTSTSLTQPDEPLALARYDSTFPGVSVALQQRIPEICQRNPDTIYWGGRGADLPAFIAALGSRDRSRCPGPITVVTADDGTGLATDIAAQNRPGAAPVLPNALRSGIKVVVTGLASPGQWGSTPNPDDPRLLALLGTCDRCGKAVFPQEKLDDGNMIMGHDALLVLVRAARAGVDQQTLGAVSNLTVRQGLVGFGVARPVAGASGDIGFDDAGKPIAKPIPILVLDDKGGITYQGSS